MYRKVKKAWVILGPNGENELTVLFDEPYVGDHIPNPIPGEASTYCRLNGDGTVVFGMFDKYGHWWSSSPEVMNSEYGCDVMNATQIVLDHGTFCRDVIHLTKDFVEYILKEQALPFSVVKAGDNRPMWVLVQTESIIGTEVDTPFGKAAILDRSTDYGNERFLTKIANGTKTKSYWWTSRCIRHLYKGTEWETFRNEATALAKAQYEEQGK